MSLIKRTPFSDFENFMPSWNLPWAHEGMDMSREMTWRPSVDITEEDKEFLIEMEIPEVKKENLKVEVENGILNIMGERNEEFEDRKRHRIERFFGTFERSFTLPENVREDGVSANMENGMLYVHLLKTEFPKGPHRRLVDIN